MTAPPECIRLEVDGDPVAWARARRQGRRYFTDPRVTRQQQAIRQAWMAAGSRRLDGPLTLVCSFFIPRPPSHLKKDGGLRAGRPLLPTGKPDVDNLIKLVADALQDTKAAELAFRDDAQIVQFSATKTYVGEGEGRTSIDLVPLRTGVAR